MQPDLTLGLLALPLLTGRGPHSEAGSRMDLSGLLSINDVLESRFGEIGMTEVLGSAIMMQKPI